MKVEIACTIFGRLRGLIGRREFDGVLLLTPCNDVHTFGMRHPIDVAFIAPDGAVLESHRRVQTRQRVRCKAAVATVERFSTESPWFDRGDQIELKQYAREIRGRTR